MKKKSILNLIYGGGGQILVLAVGILLPRFIIVNYGSEVNGFISSVNQFFIFLSLLEAGVGAASLQAIYEPLSKKDISSVNGILSATNREYRKTAVIYFLMLLLLAILYPYIIKNSLPKEDIFMIIIINGSITIFNFVFINTYKIFIEAEGKLYVNQNIYTITFVLSNLTKLLLIKIGWDVVSIQLSWLLFSLVAILLTVAYVKKNYDYLNLKVKSMNEAIEQKSSVFIHQITQLIFNNTDIVVLSFFSGLEYVSIYSLYLMLYGAISRISLVLSKSINFVLGQKFHIDVCEFMKLYDAYEYLSILGVYIINTILFINIIPFMKIYTLDFNDSRYVDSLIALMFFIIAIIGAARTASVQAIAISGKFKETKKHALYESILNIVISLLLIKIWNIYGVLLGTIVSSLYRTIYLIDFSAKNIVMRSKRPTYKRWAVNSFVFIIYFSLNEVLGLNITTYTRLIVFAIINSIITITGFLLVNIITDFKTVKYIYSILKSKMS